MSHKISLKLKITLLFTALIILVTVFLTLISNYNLDRYFVRDMIDAGTSAGLEGEEPELIVSQSVGNSVSVHSGQVASLKRLPWPKTVRSAANQYLLPSAEAQTLEPSATQADIMSITYKIAVAGKKSFVNSGWIFSSILILFGVGAAYIILGKALSPLQRLSRMMGKIDEKNLSVRVENNASSRELVQLTGAYNKMMERLDKAFEAQKNFAAAAAHELKTPLACMQAELEVLQMDEHPSEQDYRKTIDVVNRNTSRLISLVEELLAVNMNSRREKYQWIQMEPLMEEICRELAPQIQQKKLNVQSDCQGSVYGDSAFLYRAFYNLIENAVKYNHIGGRIKLISRERANQCRIIIADTGIGIPEEEIAHIFEPFYRVDKSRSREIGGSGLGLAIVKDIIENHHGKISVRQKQGSIFEIVLPKE